MKDLIYQLREQSINQRERERNPNKPEINNRIPTPFNNQPGDDNPDESDSEGSEPEDNDPEDLDPEDHHPRRPRRH